jgi:hypothetical protein
MNKLLPMPIALCACLVFSLQAFETKVNEDSKRIADFEARVAAYLNLHNKARTGLPTSKPTSSPEEISSRQSELAAKIRALRPKAKSGQIFTPRISAEFRRLIKISWQGSDAKHMEASFEHSEPVHVALQVNGAYPSRVPLQSTPPTLLQNLPPLPKELEYRVVGRRLVLRDIAANLIVDFTGEIVP